MLNAYRLKRLGFSKALELENVQPANRAWAFHPWNEGSTVHWRENPQYISGKKGTWFCV